MVPGVKRLVRRHHVRDVPKKLHIVHVIVVMLRPVRAIRAHVFWRMGIRVI